MEGTPPAQNAPGSALPPEAHPPLPAMPPAGPPGWTRPPRPGPAPGIEFAGFWVRTGAYLLDAIPLFIVSLVLFIPTFAAIGQAVGSIPYPYDAAVYSQEYLDYQRALSEAMIPAMSGLYPAFGLVQLVSLAYFIGFWTWRGQTPGMMLLGLRVARDQDGAPPGLGRSILRYIGYWLSWIALFIGFIWVAFDARKQGWHDKIAGTVVVRRAA